MGFAHCAPSAAQAGDMINTELEAKYGGYIAQTVQAACLGRIPLELKRAFDVSVKVFDELVKFMKPGVIFREVVTYYRRLVKSPATYPKECCFMAAVSAKTARKSPASWRAMFTTPPPIRCISIYP